MTPELALAWINGLGGRRFVMTAGCGLVTTLMRIGGFISGSEYVTIILATVAVYIAAETHSKVEAKKVDGAQGA